MKQVRIANLIILLVLAHSVNAQNLVSPVWKISSVAGQFQEIESINDKDWPQVNLLLSWERQGYSWMNNVVCLRNTFKVDNTDELLNAVFSLQADVIDIYLNEIRIGGNVSNSFWSDRGKQTSIQIPSDVLRAGVNNLTVLIGNPSYTGGLSHNVFKVIPNNGLKENKLDFVFEDIEHVFGYNNNISFGLSSQSHHDGSVELLIKSDFHTLVYSKQYAINEGDDSVQIDLSKLNLNPGFYECTAILNDGSYTGSAAWFAVSPEKITCSAEASIDFNTYWSEALNELNEISPQFSMQQVDSLCSDTRTGYVVEMQSLGNLTIRGYYFVPKGEGAYPVILHVPGYSYGFEHHEGFLSNKDNIAELALCVRGHGISADVFNPWADQTLWSVNICDKQKQIYRSIYMDCVRAVEFLKSRPEINKEKIGVAGGSQGGGLAIATAGLLPDDIAACAFFDPFLSDIREHTNIRQIIKNEFDMFLEHPNNNCSIDDLLKNQDLIDVKGFASKITCPVYFEAALFDDDCPVHTGFAAYNLIQSDKEYRIYPYDSHLGESGEYGNIAKYITRLLLEE